MSGITAEEIKSSLEQNLHGKIEAVTVYRGQALVTRLVDVPGPAGLKEIIVGELPGEAEYNLYYWYYATLGTYQLQGVHWQRWNEAMFERS